jgi:hypothetical protein
VHRQGPEPGSEPRRRRDLNATLPTVTKLSAISSACTTADGKFPCTLGDILDGSTVTATFTISLPEPDPYPTICAGNNSATAGNTVKPFSEADVAVTSAGPATANQGENVAYKTW